MGSKRKNSTASSKIRDPKNCINSQGKGSSANSHSEQKAVRGLKTEKQQQSFKFEYKMKKFDLSKADGPDASQAADRIILDLTKKPRTTEKKRFTHESLVEKAQQTLDAFQCFESVDDEWAGASENSMSSKRGYRQEETPSKGHLQKSPRTPSQVLSGQLLQKSEYFQSKSINGSGGEKAANMRHALIFNHLVPKMQTNCKMSEIFADVSLPASMLDQSISS